MRAPPPLRWHCADVHVWRAFSTTCFALACAAMAAWGLSYAEIDGPWRWLVPLCVAAAAFMCGWRLLPANRGTLEWTGAAWTWQAEGSAAAVELREARLRIDLHATLLLRLRTAGPSGAVSRTAWVVVQRAQDPLQWPLLCALLCGCAPASAAPPRQG